MDDFLKLFVAKLANQDMYNTVDDTEFMGADGTVLHAAGTF
jgi:flagellar hook assembly protein FlgD